MFKKMLLCGFIAVIGASIVAVPYAAQAAQQLPGETISFDPPGGGGSCTGDKCAAGGSY